MQSDIQQNLARCRDILGSIDPATVEKKSAREWLRELTGVDLDRCPSCRAGTMRVTAEIPEREINSS